MQTKTYAHTDIQVSMHCTKDKDLYTVSLYLLLTANCCLCLVLKLAVVCAL